MQPTLRAALLVLCVSMAGVFAPPHAVLRVRAQAGATATPIQHLVVIFQENVSFDHYFATYPNAANPAGEPVFNAAPNTPSVNGLNAALLYRNTNLDQPFRLDRTQALTCDMDHNYQHEQQAYDSGLVDQFVQKTEGKASNPAQYCPTDAAGNLDAVMGYYDGNTVTAIWNYAQNFAMSDNAYNMIYGPSTPGALGISAADTSSVVCGPQSAVYGDVPRCGDDGGPPASSTSQTPPSSGAMGAMYGDAQPWYDICSRSDGNQAVLSGTNIGDLLNQAGLTWGWFEGGFALGPDGTCSSKHAPEDADRAVGTDPSTDTNTAIDYIPHHEPFQLFPQTANPMHLPPSSDAMIGHTDQANHQYDLTDFWTAADAGNLPAVSYLKAPAYQDGHAGYSDPLDEQRFLVQTIDHLESLPTWSSTAVIIAYDDSDGWYDHVMPPTVNESATPLDGNCGPQSWGMPGRCGYGPRLPFLVISPYAKQNYVSHTLIDQSSIVRFIEDNWLGGQRLSNSSFDQMAGSILDMFDFSQKPTRTLMLDPVTGLAASGLAH